MKMKKIKLTVMATAFSVMLGLSSGVVNAEVVNEAKTASHINITRISGEDRYQTSLNISDYMLKEFGRSKFIVLSNGSNYSDSLPGGTLASELKSPLLLINNNIDVSNYTAYFYKNRISYPYLVGGENTISNNIVNLIKKYHKIERLSGRDCYETAASIYTVILDERGVQNMPNLAAVYNSNKYTDALVATPFIYEYNLDKMDDMLPLMPISPSKKDAPIAITFGGENTLPYAKGDYRFSGEDRYKTAVNVAKAYKTMLDKEVDTIVLTNGQDYPDALCAGPLASRKDAPILLTSPKTLNEDTKQYIKSNPNIKNVIIVGGENSVSMEVENELKGLK